jgi:predicted oxidoreductase
MDHMEDETPEIFMEVEYVGGGVEQWNFHGYQVTRGWMFLHPAGSAAVLGSIRLDQVRSMALKPPCIGFDRLLLAGLKEA